MLLKNKHDFIHSDFFLILITFLIVIFDHLFAERIIINHGLGWDGINYGHWAENFYEQIVVNGVDSYHLQRVLPSACIHYLLRLFFIPLTIPNIIEAFSLVNAILITLMAWVWCLIVAELKISNCGKWLGFIGLFFNYAVLKYFFYYPVLTDIYAYAIGLSMVYFFLTERLLSLYVITILASFVWPIALYFGTVLLVFPRNNSENANSRPVPFSLNIVVACVCTIIFLILALFIYFITDGMLNDCIPISKPLLGLSIPVAMIYLLFGIRKSLDDGSLFDWHYWRSRIAPLRQSLVLATFIGINFFIHFAATESWYGIKQYLKWIIYTSIIQPGVFLVAHTIYYGPVFLLMLLLWPRICKLMHNYGIGLTLCCTIGVFLSLGSESRQLVLLYAIILPFVVKVTDSFEWGEWYYWLLGVIAFILSKIWLPINLEPFYGKYSEFPWQLYYMSHGPWMSSEMYVVQGLMVLVSLGIIYRFMFYPKKQSLTVATALNRADG